MKRLGLAVIKLAASLPRNRIASVITSQIVRSGTSPGANYRAACRSRSKAEFIARMGVVEEELDETLYWLEVLVESEIVQEAAVRDLSAEGNELLSIVVSSIRTARSHLVK